MSSGWTFENLLSRWEEAIRAGRIEAVHAQFNELDLGSQLNRLPRCLAIPFASVLRRADLTLEAIKLLRPWITASGNERATDPEVIEYCNSLKKLGLANEAFNRLIRIDPEKTPEVLVNQANYHIRRWNYPAVIPLLNRYIRRPGLDEYKRAVAEANLASAYLESDELDAAVSVVRRLETECREKKWTRLLINCLEMQTEYFLKKRDLSAAEAMLERARDVSLSDSLRDLFFLEKRRAILEGLKTGSAAALKKVREESVRRSLWESVRDIDFQILLIEEDEELKSRLYHGTSHYGFQRRMEKRFRNIAPVYKINGDHPRTLNLSTGKEGDAALLKPGQTTHKLLYALVSDFYMPIDIGFLFNAVFRGEDFNHETSANRVHQAILRARNWFDGRGIPLQIEEVDGVYRFRFQGAYTLLKERETQPLSNASVFLEDLRKRFESREFTIQEVCDGLKINRSKASRALKVLVENGLVEVKGRSRSVRYAIRSGAN